MPSTAVYNEVNRMVIEKEIARLKVQSSEDLIQQGIAQTNVKYEVYLNMRYYGTDTPLMVQRPATGDFQAAFLEAHMREFTFLLADRDIIVDDIRVRAIGNNNSAFAIRKKSPLTQIKHLGAGLKDLGSADAATMSTVYMDGYGRVDTPVFHLGDIQHGSRIVGLAMVVDTTQTIVVPPRCTAIVLAQHVLIQVDVADNHLLNANVVDPIQLSVFSQRFMAIAEMMGRTLQKTAVSANIAERLDFSCALFGPDGGLVANGENLLIPLRDSLTDQHISTACACPSRFDAKLHRIPTQASPWKAPPWRRLVNQPSQRWRVSIIPLSSQCVTYAPQNPFTRFDSGHSMFRPGWEGDCLLLRVSRPSHRYWRKRSDIYESQCKVPMGGRSRDQEL